MNCRAGCGACCIAASIATEIPGMPGGKPAGMRCVNLDDANLCMLWGTRAMPEFCRAFAATPETCGGSTADALRLLGLLERRTSPGTVAQAVSRGPAR